MDCPVARGPPTVVVNTIVTDTPAAAASGFDTDIEAAVTTSPTKGLDTEVGVLMSLAVLILNAEAITALAPLPMVIPATVSVNGAQQARSFVTLNENCVEDITNVLKPTPPDVATLGMGDEAKNPDGKEKVMRSFLDAMSLPPGEGVKVRVADIPDFPARRSACAMVTAGELTLSPIHPDVSGQVS